MSAIGADQPRELTPLEMAENCAAAVARYAETGVRDPLGSFIARGGDKGHAAAQLAGNLALVSIAQDMHRIVNVMLGHSPEDNEIPIKAWARGDDIMGGGPVDDARATREHMRDWAEGGTTHRGEEKP